MLRNQLAVYKRRLLNYLDLLLHADRIPVGTSSKGCVFHAKHGRAATTANTRINAVRRSTNPPLQKEEAAGPQPTASAELGLLVGFRLILTQFNNLGFARGSELGLHFAAGFYVPWLSFGLVRQQDSCSWNLL